MVSRETADAAPELPDWLVPSTDQLTAFAAILADEGVERGLIGPREVPRLWQRHLLNCAVVAAPAAELIPVGVRAADVGSGAGLPGLVWAIVRPDLRVVLIEPLLRRSTFLDEAVARLGLGERVEVRRGRAEDIVKDPRWSPVDVVTARAVAPFERLIGWTVPLLAPGGWVIALKGSSAAQELAQAGPAAAAAGLVDLRVDEVGAGIVEPVTTVIVGRRRAAE